MAAPSLQIDPGEFPTVLRKRMDGYFRDAGISKKGTPLMTGKIVAGLSAAAMTYAALYLIPMNGREFLLAYVLFGLTQLYIMLNTAHDSNHYSITGNQRVSRLLSHILDAMGINSYIWRILHNVGHHSGINVVGEDEDLLARGYLRLSPQVPRKWFHRGQHIYCWVAYSLSFVDWVFMKDYIYFFFSGYRLTARAKHPLREYVGLFFWKGFYYTYMLVLPVVILKRSPWLVALAFLCAQAAIGLCAQFVFQTTHVLGSSYFPRGKSDYDNYTYHVLATTADYSTDGKLPFLFLGGLNYHVAHHLCPNVCHVHYPALTKIIRETAAEYHVPYRSHRTIWQALALHYRHLRQLAVEA